MPADIVMKPSQSRRASRGVSSLGSTSQLPTTERIATGKIIQKPQRQPSASAICPANIGPMDGPIMLAMP